MCIFQSSEIQFIFINPFHFILLLRVFFIFLLTLIVGYESHSEVFFIDFEFKLHAGLEILSSIVNASQLATKVNLSDLITAIPFIILNFRSIVKRSYIFIKYFELHFTYLDANFAHFCIIPLIVKALLYVFIIILSIFHECDLFQLFFMVKFLNFIKFFLNFLSNKSIILVFHLYLF